LLPLIFLHEVPFACYVHFFEHCHDLMHSLHVSGLLSRPDSGNYIWVDIAQRILALAVALSAGRSSVQMYILSASIVLHDRDELQRRHTLGVGAGPGGGGSWRERVGGGCDWRGRGSSCTLNRLNNGNVFRGFYWNTSD
jgi:hypothetical protein